MKGFVVLPRRWVVERTFSWFGRNRRLAKDFENLAETLATYPAGPPAACSGGVLTSTNSVEMTTQVPCRRRTAVVGSVSGPSAEPAVRRKMRRIGTFAGLRSSGKVRPIPFSNGSRATAR